jgi:hypothetical protein
MRKPKRVSQKALTTAEGEVKVVRFEATKEEVFGATGGRSDEVARMILIQADYALQPDGERTPETVLLTMKTIGELGPRNATEGMLAVQMIGVHKAATEFIRRSQVTGQTVEGSDANINRAVRLMRLFNEQLDAMAKLKGTAGQQKMTVEHVHVHAGGQAIVGPVSGGDGTLGGGESK